MTREEHEQKFKAFFDNQNTDCVVELDPRDVSNALYSLEELGFIDFRIDSETFETVARLYEAIKQRGGFPDELRM